MMKHRSKPAAVCLFVALLGLVHAGGANERDIHFVDVTKSAGLIEPLTGIMGHGGAWGDFDGDGLLDLFVGGFCDRPNKEYAPAESPVPSKLFRNLGRGKFELVKGPPTGIFGRTSGAVFADLDNNGTLEVYVANNARAKTKVQVEPQKSANTQKVQLFRNDGGKFADISKASGACPENMLTARNIGVFDYDGDGLLDLFVVEDRFTAKPRSVLFRNKGELRFEDVNDQVGLPNDIFGLGLAVADVNGDGKPDFFVAHSNRLFLSQPGLKYREAVELKEVFAWKSSDREDWPCGAAFADLNRDGLLDLVLTIHHVAARNKVFLNEGVKDGIPRFRDVTKEVGLGDVVPARCPHVEVQDFNNDGWPDIYTSAAWHDENGAITPLVYRHLGVKDGLPRFAPPRPIKAPMVYFPAGPSGDYDNDGRVDIVLINWFQGNHCRLLHNESSPNSWLDVQVVGTKMNRMGIGAQVKVFRPGMLGDAKGLVGLQEVTIGYGYASGQPALCHFGLGELAAVDVLVTLPGGEKLERKNVKTGQRLVLEEGK